MIDMQADKLKLKSSPCQIVQMETFLKDVSKQYNLTADVYGNILISLTEAVNNAIKHGNKNDKNKFVKIRLKEKSDTLVFKISDEGNGFNPNNLPDPTALDRIEKDGGRGVYIMRCLCDNIKFQENGRTVILTFKR